MFGMSLRPSYALTRLGLVASGYLEILARVLRAPSRSQPPGQRGGFRKRKQMRRRSSGRVVNGLSIRSLFRAANANDSFQFSPRAGLSPAERARKGFMHSHARQMFYLIQRRAHPDLAF